jgi:hypothetical protein
MQLCHKQLGLRALVLSKITVLFWMIDRAGRQYVPNKNVLNGINTLVNISSFNPQQPVCRPDLKALPHAPFFINSGQTKPQVQVKFY